MQDCIFQILTEKKYEFWVPYRVEFAAPTVKLKGY